MKNILAFIFLFSCATNLFSQSQSFKVDYKVDYEIHGKDDRKDSISINFNKEGTIIYTSSNLLGKDIIKTLSPRISQNNANTNILLNVLEEAIYMNIESGKTQLFFKANLDDFLPVNTSAESKMDTIIRKEIKLICDKTDKILKRGSKEYNFYSIYPEGEENDPIYVAFDINKDFDSNKFFNSILGKFAASENEVLLPTSIQKGIILEVRNGQGKTILKAINIEEKSKNITYNYSFIID